MTLSHILTLSPFRPDQGPLAESQWKIQGNPCQSLIGNSTLLSGRAISHLWALAQASCFGCIWPVETPLPNKHHTLLDGSCQVDRVGGTPMQLWVVKAVVALLDMICLNFFRKEKIKRSFIPLDWYKLQEISLHGGIATGQDGQFFPPLDLGYQDPWGSPLKGSRASLVFKPVNYQ